MKQKLPINILITSPEGYSERFSLIFSESCLNPVAIPMIETVIPENMPDMNHLFTHLHRYEYIAFSSRKAIESFHGKWRRSNVPLTGIKFCAIGKDTEYMVDKLGVKPSIYPDEPSPVGIVNKLNEDKNSKGKTIAALVPLVEGMTEPNIVPDFLEKLGSIGMNVTRINAYITRSVDNVQTDRAVHLIRAKEIQCVAFTSGAEVEVLLRNINDNSLLENIVIACFGPYTAKCAQKKGLNVSIVSQDFSSFSGFLKAIEEYYCNTQ